MHFNEREALRTTMLFSLQSAYDGGSRDGGTSDEQHLRRPPAALAVWSLFGTWVTVGAIVFGVTNGFGAADALYFSIQSGLGVGFCSLQETSQWSRVYACLHMLCGGLAISVALSAGIERALAHLATAAAVDAASHPSHYSRPRWWCPPLVSLPSFRGAPLGIGCICLFTYLLVGTAYFNARHGLDVIKSAELCVSAVTTTGLLGLRPRDDNSLPVEASLSLAIYTLAGVTLYIFVIRETTQWLLCTFSSFKVTPLLRPHQVT
jgi:hypothetical protein